MTGGGTAAATGTNQLFGGGGHAQVMVAVQMWQMQQQAVRQAQLQELMRQQAQSGIGRFASACVARRSAPVNAEPTENQKLLQAREAERRQSIAERIAEREAALAERIAEREGRLAELRARANQ